ncbi:phosphatidylinositol 4-phosphate 5-kinase 2-like [Phthorimaea operculella]|nr:phosphatidylinositol 4-phosphate 5-kinase 2-like [Phthorimaea operculella]
MADNSNSEEASSLPTKKGREKEVTVIQATGFFKFDTGDTYDGSFEARKRDRSVRMQGQGTYTTNEGDSYTGVWDNDKLGSGGQEVTISYHSGAKYEGFLQDWCYHGKGKYTYPDGSVLECHFDDNCPVGQLELKDPNGHIWYGKAQQGFALFEPTNHYYQMLDSVIDKAEIRRRRRELNLAKQPPLARKAEAPVVEELKKKVKIVGVVQK